MKNIYKENNKILMNVQDSSSIVYYYDYSDNDLTNWLEYNNTIIFHKNKYMRFSDTIIKSSVILLITYKL